MTVQELISKLQQLDNTSATIKIVTALESNESSDIHPDLIFYKFDKGKKVEYTLYPKQNDKGK